MTDITQKAHDRCEHLFGVAESLPPQLAEFSELLVVTATEHLMLCTHLENMAEALAKSEQRLAQCREVSQQLAKENSRFHRERARQGSSPPDQQGRQEHDR